MKKRGSKGKKKSRSKRKGISNVESNDDTAIESLPAPLISSVSPPKEKKRTKFRRNYEEAKLESKREERRTQQEEGYEPAEESQYKPICLVDGYNIIFNDEKRNAVAQNDSLLRARRDLIRDLEAFKRFMGWTVEVVFDGNGFQGYRSKDSLPKGATLDEDGVYREITKGNIRVVFTGPQDEADFYIERRCFEIMEATSRGKAPRDVIVATDDRDIQSTAINVGGFFMGSNYFNIELQSMKKILPAGGFMEKNLGSSSSSWSTSKKTVKYTGSTITETTTTWTSAPKPKAPRALIEKRLQEPLSLSPPPKPKAPAKKKPSKEGVSYESSPYWDKGRVSIHDVEFGRFGTFRLKKRPKK